METYNMFMDWKNQYFQNDYITQGNLQIQCNPSQTTNGIFNRTRTTTKKNLKICVETQRFWIASTKLKNKNRIREIRLPESWLFYKTRVIKTLWYWHQNRNMDQWNRIGNPERNPFSYDQSVNAKRQDYSRLERQSLQQMIMGKLDSHMFKKWN